MLPRWGMRVFCVPLAWTTHHARRQASALAIAVEQQHSAVEPEPRFLEPSLLPSSNDALSGGSSSTVSTLEKRRDVGTSVTSPGRHRNVQIDSAAIQQLPHEKQLHLTQLEGLLRRRVRHSCRVPSHAHRPATEHNIAGPCGTCRLHSSVSRNPLPSFAPPSQSQPNGDPPRSASSAVPHRGLFVMCRVVAQPLHLPTPQSGAGSALSLDNSNETHTYRLGTVEGRTEEEVFTGVNHAFHKHVNPHAATLRGILKGCAEQNALGAVAASGCAYTDVTDVFVLAVRAGAQNEGGEDGLFNCDDAAAIFPCAECWRHLCHVARVRHQHALPRLRLFVSASSPAATVHLLSLAHQRTDVMEEPMEVRVVTRYTQGSR
ncbi:putative mitochondrial hypothetical protein [Leptomonas pyrrhocoris]|uniref:Uncharacterized protein n=1 Tax=Leptomonas pyrrhocoris TaxID=157538 RepID=A0A0N0DVM7_LEPPY|nr:putative mitochondrial hypothetical protein [Leptomonas pyrrhocoris]KPA80591.1 putative mitochondrial hypothetical protein [Leptomonas pyrrhocoris]|eukprot:XP_015659030.1 putative mitochondrial hypothetical protein [Leptomonas pyrrhocoris]